MNATFVALALVSALSPKLLGVDLLLMNSRRRTLTFALFLLGGMGIALAVGLLDVLVWHADAIETQGSISAGLDLTLGVLLVAVGALIATGRLRGSRRAPTHAGHEQDAKPNGWAQRILREPRFSRIVLIGVVCGVPGAKYLAALHALVTGSSSTAAQIVSVVVFVLLEFSLVIVPFLLLVFTPQRAEMRVKHAEAWLMSHSRELIAGVLLVVGTYMVLSGLVRLMG